MAREQRFLEKTPSMLGLLWVDVLGVAFGWPVLLGAGVGPVVGWPDSMGAGVGFLGGWVLLLGAGLGFTLGAVTPLGVLVGRVAPGTAALAWPFLALAWLVSSKSREPWPGTEGGSMLGWCWGSNPVRSAGPCGARGWTVGSVVGTITIFSRVLGNCK